MKLSSVLTVVIAFLFCLGTLSAQTSFPRVTTVTPATVKVGEVITAAGENLDKDNVAELFLTDNKSDFRVQINEQSATAITFTVPDSVRPGRFGLVIRTSATQTTPVKDYIQPVRLTVE